MQRQRHGRTSLPSEIAAELPKAVSQTKSLHASKSHYRQTQQQNEHPENSSNPWVALNMVDRLRV
jgi:hypothetical protein